MDNPFRFTEVEMSNGYPQHLVIIKPHLKWISSGNEEQQRKGTAGLSEFIEIVFDSLDIRVCFKPHQCRHTLGQLFPTPKDKPENMESSGIVYNI